MRPRRGRLALALLSAVLLAAPAANAVLDGPATPAAAAAPSGTAAWRADPRRLPDPVTATPAAVHAALAGAPGSLATRYPEVVGELDGAPVALRYRANRAAMAATGAPYAGWRGRYLLFDPRGDGRVAQVFGDLSTADRIAVLVPGVDDRLANFHRGLGGKAYRSPAVQAANLYRAAGGRIAVVAWLGYQTPHGVGIDAARERLAATGAVALRRFVAGLTALRPSATIALLGHSYGSTVIGLAARYLPGQVTDIAVFGSPGMGVGTAKALHSTARVWAGQSRHDWIRYVPGLRLFGFGHGRKPADPAFGARVFPTADVSDHDHYLAPGTESLDALARIASGIGSPGRVQLAAAAGRTGGAA
ncbi:hypothetical protein Athai_03930 [Actinocatenispora thailandica]|uniref:DUF1023 domain-containing protein n=1 Tax=Actinocatenispora thailandica TaxID=227318 RepID=A0A7R7DJI1_9ACTN|nr:alpha/beta hydrolase [Actinocatenispora thailandica]BCJ32890.1 hypothetical protein Athai_03930 [Actinocatenispora thailandica]